MGKPKIPDLLEQKIIKWYETHKSVFVVARRFRVGSSTVHRVLKRNGIECDGLKLYRKKIKKLPDTETLRVDYDAGMSLSEIGKKYGVTQSSVRDAFVAAGIKRRRRGGVFRPLTPEEERKVISLYKMFRSQTTVADALGIHQIKVSDVLRRAGIYTERFVGENHPSWKGGRVKVTGGYIAVRLRPDDPLYCMTQGRDGYALEHRIVMARALARTLENKETVHHINGDKSDNRLENLQLMQSGHPKGIRMCCAECGSFNLKCVELT